MERRAPAARWAVTTEWAYNGRHVNPGTELTVDVSIGKATADLERFRFIRHVRNERGAEWIDVVSETGGFRAFRPDRIRTVHRLNRTRASAGRTP